VTGRRRRRPAARGRRLLAAALATLLLTGAATVVRTAPASADTAPTDAGTPATVAVDALPTVQVDGVVWAQLVVGNTVYAGGKFTTARPAGAAPGSGTTPRGNLLAYDIRTGSLVTSFAPSLNGQVRGLTASPDGSRVYVAGEFTQADGATRNRIAAYSTATGQLLSAFAPSLDFRATSVVATAGTVYVGGAFNVAGGNPRSRLAAFRADTGALLSWAPAADAQVLTMLMTPDQTKIVVGGQFTTLNGLAAYGMGALDPTTGEVLPWAANQLVRNAGTSAAINSLSTDGTKVYGTGYVFGPGGNFEGTFAADPADGKVVWIEDCHGDTYSSYPVAGAVYTVAHAHYCGNVGGFPETDPRTFSRGLAWSAGPAGTVRHDTKGYYDWYGQPAPALLTWFPQLDAGSFTGQTQAAWNVTGNADYVVMGGEFPRVNGTPQQGLVRFATRAIAPNKQGPVLRGAQFLPSLASPSAGTVRVSWPANWDRDNATLTYQVVRDGDTATPVFRTTAASTFWNRPTLGFTDQGLNPGQSYRYRLSATDALGNVVLGDTVSVTAATAGPSSAYSTGVLADGASSFWRLGEASGSTAYDSARFDDLAWGAGVTHGATGAILGDEDAASVFDGSPTASGATPNAVPAPDTFTAEAWIKTTTTTGGKVFGFGNRQTGTSSSYDRHVYMDAAGRLVLGVYDSGARVVASQASYNDGAWHHVVASLSAAGMTLYVDAKRVGRDPATTKGQPYSGYWRIGGDNLGNWPSRPTSSFFTGAIDDVAIYPTALTVEQVQAHYVNSGRPLASGGKPTDTYGAAVYGSAPESYWRLDETQGPVALDTTANGLDGRYTGGVGYGAAGAVPGSGTAVTLDGSTAAVAAAGRITSPTVYSEEIWFRTTTTRGGRLIGFGNAQTGSSSSYDRHVYMLDDGRLRFGVYTGQTNVIDTDASYNDGGWHHVVAVQDGSGMKLYVDGSRVGTHPQAQAQIYAGYWRVGGDNTWGGASSNDFAGTVDEAAIYAKALPPDEILDHYRQGGGATQNVPPAAAFTTSASGLTASFDGSGSTDRDGSVVSYAWDFGDGSTGAGALPQHTYAAGGTFPVTLAVTDDKGANGSVSNPVTVTTPPAPASYASDAFGRTVTGGWGGADLGGAWFLTGGAANFSVAGGSARLRLATAGSGPTASLRSVSAVDTEVRVAVSLDKIQTGGGTYLSVVGRRAGTAGDYRVKLRYLPSGGVTAALVRVAAGGQTALQTVTLPGVTYLPGEVLQVRLQITGASPTLLRAKVWRPGQTEPSWQLSATDATGALQVAGSVAVAALLSASSTNGPLSVVFDDFWAGRPVA